MKRPLILLLACLFTGLAPWQGHAQTYVKMNGLYALVGVINPAVEFPISRKSTFQSELVISPWKSVTVKEVTGPMKFGIFMNEYRRYFQERNHGWYLAANGGLMIFDMTKPTRGGSGIRLKRNSSKGYGMMFGMAGGYERKFKEKWLLDVYFGWSYMYSKYNGYALVDGLVEGGRVYNKGEVILTPHRTGYDGPDDPFNGSAEWLPNKIGISLGLLIFDPQKKKNR